MIDYDKLKIAHDLADKTGTHYLVHTSKNYDNEVALFNRAGNVNEGCFFNLDSLIDTLKELFSLENKFKIGQTVYYIDDEEHIQSLEIKRFYRAGYLDRMYCYQSVEAIEDNIQWLESQLYASKNELIEAQIAYWNGLKGI